MITFFDIDSVFFTVLNYPMSYLEFFATLAGAVAVWMSAKGNVWNWPVGLINIVLSFFLFYQVQLYPDMFLQIFFLCTNLIGWWRWTHPLPVEEDQKHELRVSYMTRNQWVVVASGGVAGTFVMGSIAENLHELFPAIFSLPSAFPYADSFITVMSIITTFLIIQKKIESWLIWIVVDALAAILYYAKDIKFIALEYVAFCAIAGFGLWNWSREFKRYNLPR